MANNGFPAWLGWAAIVVIAILVYFTFIAERGEGVDVVITDVGGDFAEPGGYVEGIYDPDTGACLLDRKGMVLARCCLKRLSDDSFVQVACGGDMQSFWLGGEFKTKDYCDTYSIYFRNTGEVVIDSADVTSVTIGAQEVVSGNIVSVPSELLNSWNYLVSNTGFLPKTDIPVDTEVLYGWIQPPLCYNDWAPDDETAYLVTIIADYDVAGESGTSQGTLAFTVDYASRGLELSVR